MIKVLRQSIHTCLILLVFIFSGCGSSEPEPVSQTNTSDPANLVRTKEVELHTMNEVMELPGNLEAENIANVLTTTEGKLTRMTVREGDKVEAGQVIAMISPLLREDIINAARINLQDREQALNANPGDETLKKEVDQARSDYEFAMNQYHEIPVIATISGLISGRWVDIGDMVPARFKMFEIQSNDNLIVNVPVSELDIRKLSVGQTARIDSDACPDRIFQGRIQRIHPRVDQQTRNATVEILLRNPCTQLRTGMFVRASFIIQTINNAVAVPVPAIIERGGQRSVFIVEDGLAHEVIIETGLETNGLAEVISGLSEGTRLVIEGQGQLLTGLRVRIMQDTTDSNNEGGML